MQCKDERVVPTTQLFLYGLVAIQQKGDKVSSKELKKETPFKGLSPNHPEYIEVNQPWQFCRVEGKVRLADYGRKETVQVLKDTNAFPFPV